MNDFSFMGMLLDLGSYLQAYLWHSSLVFQQPWEEAMHSSHRWAKDKLSKGEIRYFELSQNQSPVTEAPAVSDETRAENCGTGAEHGSSSGMGETQGVDQEELVETRSAEGEKLILMCSRPHDIFPGLCRISEHA